MLSVSGRRGCRASSPSAMYSFKEEWGKILLGPGGVGAGGWTHGVLSLGRMVR